MAQQINKKAVLKAGLVAMAVNLRGQGFDVEKVDRILDSRIRNFNEIFDEHISAGELLALHLPAFKTTDNIKIERTRGQAQVKQINALIYHVFISIQIQKSGPNGYIRDNVSIGNALEYLLKVVREYPGELTDAPDGTRIPMRR